MSAADLPVPSEGRQVTRRRLLTFVVCVPAVAAANVAGMAALPDPNRPPPKSFGIPTSTGRMTMKRTIAIAIALLLPAAAGTLGAGSTLRWTATYEAATAA